MTHRWPLLDVYHVSTPEALVTHCLNTLDRLPLIEQFKERNVTTLQMTPLLVPGRLAPTDEMHGGFVILLNAETKEDSVLCKTVVYELGHTFEFNPITKKRLTVVAQRWLPASESFAETFAERWLSNPERASALTMFLRYSFPPRLRTGNRTPPVRLWD